MVNKVVIMAAGKGIRMLPLTKIIPKPLVKVRGKPFLYYLLKNLTKAGYNDFSIIVGYKSEMIRSFIEESEFKAEFILQKEQLGTGHAVKQAKDFVNKENFLVVGADNLWSVEDFKRVNINDTLNYITGLKHKNPENYGVLIPRDGYLKEIIEKPDKYVGDLINTGLYKFSPEIFSALEKIEKSPRGEYELTDAITMLAKENKVKIIKIRDYWLDLGKIPDIPKIEGFLKSREID